MFGPVGLICPVMAFTCISEQVWCSQSSARHEFGRHSFKATRLKLDVRQLMNFLAMAADFRPCYDFLWMYDDFMLCVHGFVTCSDFKACGAPFLDGLVGFRARNAHLMDWAISS